jgi:FkbM family methyltransferase
MYIVYALVRYSYYFDKFVPFRNISIFIGKDISMLPQIVLNVYEKTELDLLEKIQLKSNSVFWDVGANVGLYSVIFSKLNPNWKIYSFEPNYKVHDKFFKNVHFNSCRNINLEPFALGSSKGSSTLVVNSIRPGTSKIDFNPKPFASYETIATITGDELFLTGKIQAPDFIKIDVEGYELDVLNGLNLTISSFKPVLSIEVASIVWKNRITFELFLSKLNDLLMLYEAGILITNGVKKKVKVISMGDISDSVQTLILVSPELVQPDEF